MIKIANKRAGSHPSGVYVGRGSPLGNPFVIGKDGDRDEVISKFKLHLLNRLHAKDAAVCGEMNRIWSLAKAGDVTLVCYCAPLRCHSEVIKAVVESKL